MIRFISSSNPISNIRSASSMTRAFKFRKTNPLVFCQNHIRTQVTLATHGVRTSKWSSNRPGVATTRLTPFPSLSTSALLLAPPITIPNVCEWCAMRSLATPKICRASSRVGEMIIIPVPVNARRVSAYGRRRYHDPTVSGLEFHRMQKLNGRNQECQGLS